MGWGVTDMPAQDGRVALVTGANGGIGYEAALALAAKGGRVILAARNPAKGEAAVAAIREACPKAAVRLELLDLASLASVAACAERLLAAEPRLDLLINNAGVMMPPKRQITSDGFELQFGTNYLGHFALTERLLPLLRAGRQPRVASSRNSGRNRQKPVFSSV